MFSWFRMMQMFRLWKQTRLLTRIVVEVFKGMGAFFLLFFFTTFITAVGFTALRGDPFLDGLIKAWYLSFGNFEDMEAYDTTSELLMFFFSCILIPLMLLNLLIAII